MFGRISHFRGHFLLNTRLTLTWVSKLSFNICTTRKQEGGFTQANSHHPVGISKVATVSYQRLVFLFCIRSVIILAIEMSRIFSIASSNQSKLFFVSFFLFFFFLQTVVAKPVILIVLTTVSDFCLFLAFFFFFYNNSNMCLNNPFDCRPLLIMSCFCLLGPCSQRQLLRYEFFLYHNYR